MAYHEEDEVHRLITNLVMWNGDGVPVRSSASLWQRIVREVRREWRSSFSIPVMGIDVTPTSAALEQIGGTFAEALIAFHTSSLTFEQQAREICRCAKSTYHVRLELGHVQFINAFREHVQLQRGKDLARVHAYARVRSGE